MNLIILIKIVFLIGRWGDHNVCELPCCNPYWLMKWLIAWKWTSWIAWIVVSFICCDIACVHRLSNIVMRHDIVLMSRSLSRSVIMLRSLPMSVMMSRSLSVSVMMSRSSPAIIIMSRTLRWLLLCRGQIRLVLLYKTNEKWFRLVIWYKVDGKWFCLVILCQWKMMVRNWLLWFDVFLC